MGRRTARTATRQTRPGDGRPGDAAPAGGDRDECGDREEGPRASAPDDLLSPSEAARRLGVTAATLYDWLGRSDRGLLVIRGQAVTVDYLQGGPCGQGLIRIERREVDRVRDLMRVRPAAIVPRRPPAPRERFPGITVPLGRPDRPG